MNGATEIIRHDSLLHFGLFIPSEGSTVGTAGYWSVVQMCVSKPSKVAILPWNGERTSTWHLVRRASTNLFYCILGFKIKPGQTLPVCTQYSEAPVKSINSQVIQQLSSPGNYIVQITLSCQPLTHMCERVHAHTSTHLLYMAGVTSHYLLCSGSVSLRAPVASG